MKKSVQFSWEPEIFTSVWCTWMGFYHAPLALPSLRHALRNWNIGVSLDRLSFVSRGSQPSPAWCSGSCKLISWLWSLLLGFSCCVFSSHTDSLHSVARLEGVSPNFTGPSGWLPFSHPSLWSSGEIWRTHVLRELSLIMLCLCCTCWMLADVLILLPAYFSSSGLSSRCSSKCFLLRPFTTLLQNRSPAPASALQIFNENIIHVPLPTLEEMAHFHPEHRFNFSKDCLSLHIVFIDFSPVPKCLSLKPDYSSPFVTSVSPNPEVRLIDGVFHTHSLYSQFLGHKSLSPSILCLH